MSNPLQQAAENRELQAQLEQEREKHKTELVAVYEECDQKISQVQDFIVDQVDEYLKYRGIDGMNAKDVVAKAVVRDGNEYSQQDEVYLHIGNSGVTIGVASTEYGPMLVIESSAFGNNKIRQEVYTSVEGLRKVGEMLVAASDWAFTRPYCHAATPPTEEKMCCSSGDYQGLSEIVGSDQPYGDADWKVSMETKCAKNESLVKASYDADIFSKCKLDYLAGRTEKVVIETLPGTDNLGVIDDVEYFRKNIVGGLNINAAQLDAYGKACEKSERI